MTKIRMVIECPCGEEHVWWHNCPLPVQIDTSDVHVRDGAS